MAPTGISTQFDQQALERRIALQGKPGPGALLQNAKVFGVACFACLGGLLYGYNQGVFSGVLTMTAFENRTSSSFISFRPVNVDCEQKWVPGRATKRRKDG